MFEIDVQPAARRVLRRLRRADAMRIVDAIEKYLRQEPERPSKSRIKRLRGKQDATFRLRVDPFRVFYDVTEAVVTVVAILHKDDASKFYRKE
jgi:mRNA interferase RelE/StbE